MMIPSTTNYQLARGSMEMSTLAYTSLPNNLKCDRSVCFQ